MVNLRAVANRATQSINPNVSASVRVCNGYQTGANGKQQPSYADAVPVTVQAQSLTKRDIQHLAGLNLSDVHRAVYADMQLTGVDRTRNSGGDVILLEGQEWLVTAVLEDWSPTSGWCKVALTRQMPF